MTLLEAIPLRRSVRRYDGRALPEHIAETLRDAIARANAQTGLRMHLVTDERRAFTGIFAYGKFSGVANYIVVNRPKNRPELDLTAGTEGERLILLAQTLGLNTCWAGLSYHKISGAYTAQPDDKTVAYIAIGYGLTQGNSHKIKSLTQVSNCTADSPEWFRRGVEAALLAPTAINQQKWSFILSDAGGEGLPAVQPRRGRSMVGYTRVDLGIAMLHFALAAGQENFRFTEPE